jgi:predicted CXXCH cytochrome family protein
MLRSLLAALVLLTASAHTCNMCHVDNRPTLLIALERIVNIYTSPTTDAPMGIPGNMSMLCLSCHDGVSATAVDLPGSHPVSFEYAGSLRDFGIVTTPTLPLFDGRLECSTCHDVHGNAVKLLRMNDMTGMCLDCHRK